MKGRHRLVGGIRIKAGRRKIIVAEAEGKNSHGPIQHRRYQEQADPFI